MTTLCAPANYAPTRFAANAKSFIDWEALIDSLDWGPSRRPLQASDLVLMPETYRWLHRLPRGIRPLVLPRKFPRIANALCRTWSDEQALSEYLDGLVFDHRGGRQGFPALVQEELEALYHWVDGGRQVELLAA